MKKLNLGVGLLLVLTSCSSTNEVVKSQSKFVEEVVLIPCSSPEYYTNSEYFRANSFGESTDHVISKKKALSNVKSELAGSINSKIKAVVDNYLKSSELNNVEQTEERFESLTRVVINQELTGIRTICETVTRTQDGKFKTYIAIELSAQDIVEKLQERLVKDELLKIDYDYEKFKKTFNEEMNKLN
jgi:hypothetical protein